MRFVYSHHKTLDQAQIALDDYYATGEVGDGDHPEIVRRRYTSGKVWYCVELDG